MRKLFFSCLFLWTSAFSSEICLKEKLSEATPGSYVVIEQNKTFTFLHIYARESQTLLLEEVSIPAARFASFVKSGRTTGWKQWFESGALGNTCWIMSQINLETGNIEETFSFTHQGWVDRSDSNPFMTILLNLTFHEIPVSQRRRIGTPPGFHKADQRPVWNPRLIVSGQAITNAPFIAYKTRWPSDGSELARKTIEIYLPNAEANQWYPVYFPYWLEVEGKIGNAKIRVIDSGLNAISPKQNFPQRLPQLGKIDLDKEGLLVTLHSPPYWRDFLLFAEQTDSFFGNMILLPCQISLKAKEREISLFVPRNDLTQLLSKGENYRISVSPRENPLIILQSPTTYKLNLL